MITEPKPRTVTTTVSSRTSVGSTPRWSATPLHTPPSTLSSVRVPRRLVRRTGDKMLGGVCSGVADHLGIDPTLVRLLTVLVTVLGFGSVIIAYLVAWVIVPKDVDVYPMGPVNPVSPVTPGAQPGRG